TCGRSADLEAFATTFFDFPSGGMMGNCFLLHDKGAQTFLCSLVSMGEASSPVSIRAETPEKALAAFEEHCQRAGWWPENF
ncbi:hypothetical protein, partial [Rhizobium sp. Root268]|uniref:hypothetical protein n=1 Tax=Rhizobium sp. Root268 TaxID=1736506 RepID=UPI000B1B8D6E